MLAIFALAAAIGLGLLCYFWPSAAIHDAFDFTLKSITVAVIAYAASTVFARIAVMEGDRDPLTWSLVIEAVGWIAVAMALKGIFIMLKSRSGIQAFKDSSSSRN